jgi:hypothetical protein
MMSKCIPGIKERAEKNFNKSSQFDSSPK